MPGISFRFLDKFQNGSPNRFKKYNIADSIARRYITDFPGFVNTSWMDAGTAYAKFGTIGSVTTDVTKSYANFNSSISHNSLKITTDGTVNMTDVRATIAGINATNKILAFAVYCPNFANVTEIQITVGTSGLTNRRRWGAIQGNQGNRYIQGNSWQIITLPWQGGVDAGTGVTRTNVTDYQIRVQSNATGVVDLWIGALGWITVPAGKGTVSFDDGYVSLYTKAFPILQSNNIKFTAYVPAEYVNQANRLTLAQINTMIASGLCEIGYHGDGNDQRVYTSGQINRIIQKDLVYWKSKKIIVRSAAYPGGEDDLTTDGVLLRDIYARYFESARLIFQGQGETTPPADNLRLRVDPYVTNAVTTGTVSTSITNAATYGGVCHQVYHDIVDATADITTKYLTSNFTTNMTNLAGSSLIKCKVSETLI